jgi:hypothetical protein
VLITLLNDSNGTKKNVKKFGSSTIINTKRCRGAKTQEIVYPDHTNAIVDSSSGNSVQYGHIVESIINS